MQYLTSKDGTKIAYEKSGQGPALIIIGGSLADHHFYASIAKALADKFTVYNFDRRGRGESDDTDPYSVEREVEDIAALIDQAGGSAYVYGHSAGSALALLAAEADLPVARMVLADPPFTPHGEDDESAKKDFAQEIAKIQALHDSGDHKGAAAFFLSGFGLSPEDVEGMLSSPAGEGMIDCARALPHDYAVLGDGLVPTRASKVSVPTLILAAQAMPEAAEELVQLMPHATLQTMESSTHELSPEVIVKVVAPFLNKR